jgi:hypothetical protein
VTGNCPDSESENDVCDVGAANEYQMHKAFVARFVRGKIISLCGGVF